jgi:hypothetical protein
LRQAREPDGNRACRAARYACNRSCRTSGISLPGRARTRGRTALPSTTSARPTPRRSSLLTCVLSRLHVWCVCDSLTYFFYLPFRASVSARPPSTLSPCPPSTHEYQSLALKQEQIEKENAKFARRCSLGYVCVYIYAKFYIYNVPTLLVDLHENELSYNIYIYTHTHFHTHTYVSYAYMSCIIRAEPQRDTVLVCT